MLGVGKQFSCTNAVNKTNKQKDKLVMSDTAVETPTVVKPEPFEVVRQGRPDAKITVVAQDFLRGAKKEAGEFFLAPEVTLENIDQIVDYCGQEFKVALYKSRLNVLFQRYMAEASSDSEGNPKPFDKEEFVKYASELSARGLTSDQIDDEIKRLTNLIIAKLPTFTDKVAATEFALSTTMKINQLTLDKASRKRKRQEPENSGD